LPQIVRTLRSVLRFKAPELDRAAARLARCANVDDLRAVAKRRLPGGVFDYIDGAAEDELALRRNREAFTRVVFRPRVLRDVNEIDTSTVLLGRRLPIPLVLAPTGFTRIATPAGELDVARAAAARNIPYTLSTLGTRSIEDVAAASGDGARWFQVYMWRDRGLVKAMLDRAKASGYDALMLTVDTAILGRRERDIRRGFTLPPKIGLGTLIDGALHPAWTLAFVRSEPIEFANVRADRDRDGSTAVALSDYVNSQFDQSLTWADVEWLRSVSDLPVVIKGIQCVDDARIAAAEGIPAISLSNHGGRQLDGAPAPFDLLPDVVDAVGDQLAVLLDGGVRRGSDIVKACALGATACLVGRPYLYGLAAGGERGVTHVIDLLANGIRQTMALIGETSITTLKPDVLAPKI
jgi:L-lactate dehydrogenase (cytochrome)